MRFFLSIVFTLLSLNIFAGQKMSIDDYNVVWNSRSENSSESMPCGGGDIGVNVWCVGSDINMYFSRSGAFDENNALLKLGRLRIKTEGTNPDNPFFKSFRQELRLSDGSIYIKGVGGTEVRIWVDVFHPVIHIDYTCDHPREFSVGYENWRTKPQTFYGEDAHFCGLKGTKDGVTIYPDSVGYDGDQILFFHRNRNDFIFSKTVEIEELTDIKDSLWNPVRNRTFGGIIQGDGLVMGKMYTGGLYKGQDYNLWTLVSKKPQKTCHITITTNIEQTETLAEWEKDLNAIQQRQLANTSKDRKASEKWWQEFWQRSFICANDAQGVSGSKGVNGLRGSEGSKVQGCEADTAFMISRNYQLFRYMLACNAYGDSPTKFNGSLFTFDPGYVKGDKKHLTPDFRQWGGALATAQNQRLVYWPMLKSGDWDMMNSEFSFYLKAQHNAELMTKSYWGHNGACFTEQIENFGLPCAYTYGLTPRTGLRPRGKQANGYTEYLWDTVMDFCLQMLETETYEGRDIAQYIPFIESCLTFFDEHYRMLHEQMTVQPFDSKKHYVFYPGTAGETYKMATNSTQTIVSLTTVLKRLLALPEKYLTDAQRTRWQEMLSHMPPVPFRDVEGKTSKGGSQRKDEPMTTDGKMHRVIAPAQSWERMQNIEINQLYPVFPYGMYGIGLPDLEIARDTWRYGIDQPRWAKNRHESWHQDAIFCARLGLLPEAKDLVTRKLQNGRHRFPAFFGPGHDWTPDHNWGGTGMSALQEMLLQTVGDTMYILPCWPREWDVHFRLHAPNQTTVEVDYRDGKIQSLQVTPNKNWKIVEFPEL